MTGEKKICGVRRLLKIEMVTKNEIGLACVLAACLASAAWMSARVGDLRARAETAQAEAKAADEDLFLSSSQVARVTPAAFRGLVADWYWMRALQYLGAKMLNSNLTVRLDDLSPLKPKLIVPLLDTVTKLDPQFIQAHEYIAMVLPAVDRQAAIDLTKRGIINNPQAWRLQHYLGYIYWQQGETQKAYEAYAAGAKITGAPVWMNAMAAKLAAASQGNSGREIAREMYLRMYKDSEDAHIKRVAYERLMWLQSLDERERLTVLINRYRQTHNNLCPTDWQALKPELIKTDFMLDAQSGAPLDPGEKTAYRLNQQNCTIDLDQTSAVPYK